MSRLIDADALIEKEERSELDRYIDGERCYQMVVPSWVIIEAPTIDAVSVVRCKDCIHFDGFDCNRFGEPAEYNNPCSDDGNDFCSYGERRER